LERPIIFSGPMVRAILDGRKAQTRRVIKPQPVVSEGCRISRAGGWAQGYWSAYKGSCWIENVNIGDTCVADGKTTRANQRIPTPYGQPGDRLWVRECWAPKEAEHGQCAAYRADLTYQCGKRCPSEIEAVTKWRPSIHMPRWASRLTLEIVSVRPERLQEISLADIQAEGIPDDRATFNAESQLTKFRTLWDSINGKPYPWASNPWVWRIEFKRL